MSPLGGNDIGDILNAAHSGNYSGLASLGDDNTATLLSTELTNMANIQQARETNDANRKLHEMDNSFNANEADKARSFQHQMWQEQNEYNSPSAQKERLISAGLNPLSLSGLTSQPVQSSVPSAASASASSPIPMQSPQLSPAHLAPYSARGVDIAAALTNVANAGKGFTDTLVNLRNVRNNELATRSQNLLNLAKTFESAQTTSNLKQAHDVLVPANVDNIYSEIHRREKQNDESDITIEEKRSNIALNEAKRDEIRQAVVESNARIDNMRKEMNWRYYDTNMGAMHSVPGMVGRILEGTSLVKDVQEGVQAITDFVKFVGGKTAKEKAAAAWSFVEDFGKQALKSGDERLIKTYAYLNEAAKTLERKWYSAKKAVTYGLNHQVNVGGFSVVNPVPSHGDTYSGN